MTIGHTGLLYPYPHPCSDEREFIPAWSLHRLIEMMPPSIKDGFHYSLIYDIHRDAIEYICFANGGLQRSYNRLLWDTQSTDPFDNIICCIEWLIKEGCFNKEYLVDKNALAEKCKGVLEYLDYINEKEE